MALASSGQASGPDRTGVNEVASGKPGRIVGYVMAGGASSRFGFDKAEAEFDGRTMLERTLEALREITGPVSVVASPDRYQHLSHEVIPDGWPGEGPLGGIITALRHTLRTSPAPWNLIVGCDMPFLTREWLRFLCERAVHSDAEVVAPFSENGLEPLCACWRTDALEILQAAFDDRVRKVTEAMKRLRMEALDEKDWKRFDPAGRLFWNMNTPADYEDAKRILEGERA